MPSFESVRMFVCLISVWFLFTSSSKPDGELNVIQLWKFICEILRTTLVYVWMNKYTLKGRSTITGTKLQVFTIENCMHQVPHLYLEILTVSAQIFSANELELWPLNVYPRLKWQMHKLFNAFRGDCSVDHAHTVCMYCMFWTESKRITAPCAPNTDSDTHDFRICVAILLYQL